MLVLERNEGEELVLTATEPIPAGTRITVMLVRIKNHVARIGVAAPKTVTVHRKEVQDAIDRER